MIQIKRVYEIATKDDGQRILVDRVWPRGLTKDKAQVVLWLKEVGPSTQLRKWFNHEPAKWPEFRQRYSRELTNNPAFETLQQAVAKQEVTTLVYSARDTERNQAVVLKELLEKS